MTVITYDFGLEYDTLTGQFSKSAKKASPSHKSKPFTVIRPAWLEPRLTPHEFID